MCHNPMTRTSRPSHVARSASALLARVRCVWVERRRRGNRDSSAEAAAAQSEVGAEATAPNPVVAVANADYLGSYSLVDESFGTQVMVTVDGGARIITSNTLPNHETGDFPNSGNPNAIATPRTRPGR